MASGCTTKRGRWHIAIIRRFQRRTITGRRIVRVEGARDISAGGSAVKLYDRESYVAVLLIFLRHCRCCARPEARSPTCIDTGKAHGGLSSNTVWLTPGGRLWLLGWEWMLPSEQIPEGYAPDVDGSPPPEWDQGQWQPTPASDQWQLAAMLFLMLTGENPPRSETPQIGLLRPDCPLSLSIVLERALLADPDERFPSISALLRDIDRHVAVRPHLIGPEGKEMPTMHESSESRLRRATADDYEILSPLGRGMYGSVWRARDLSLSREVAIKVASQAMCRKTTLLSRRFRREARLAAGLIHPFDCSDLRQRQQGRCRLVYNGACGRLPPWQVSLPVRVLVLFRKSTNRSRTSLEGLAAAHATGIIHRDLKPENILIEPISPMENCRFRNCVCIGRPKRWEHPERRLSLLQSSCWGKCRARPPTAMRWLALSSSSSPGALLSVRARPRRYSADR